MCTNESTKTLLLEKTLLNHPIDIDIDGYILGRCGLQSSWQQATVANVKVKEWGSLPSEQRNSGNSTCIHVCVLLIRQSQLFGRLMTAATSGCCCTHAQFRQMPWDGLLLVPT